MVVPISFTHVVNPFPAPEGSEHAVASRVTWNTLRVAVDVAHQTGLRVRCKAVVLPGDDSSVELPATSVAYLQRTVQDIAALRPRRLLPLIGDILEIGARGVDTTHIIFSNMDISVQPHFYSALRDLITDQLGMDIPFTVARINVDPELATGPMEKLYAAEGTLGHGYDCFVIPRTMIDLIDVGACCIGAPHFDQLLLMALDVASGHRVRTLNHTRLTFHLGNDIAWAAMMDYVEHNLDQSLAAIARMKRNRVVQPDSVFDHLDRGHFQRNAAFTSAVLRKIRRIPVLSTAILRVKRMIGRQY